MEANPNTRDGNQWICLQPACGKLLASWNKSGYCTVHHRECDRVERRYCEQPICGERLRRDTPDTLCLKHRLQNSDKTRKSCRECGRGLNSNNQSGYCPHHHHLTRPRAT
jgi:hypothetical protein